MASFLFSLLFVVLFALLSVSAPVLWKLFYSHLLQSSLSITLFAAPYKLHSEQSIERFVVGEVDSTHFRLFFHLQGRTLSPWHDLALHPFHNPHLFHFICEIPRHTFAKMEIQTKEQWNPVAQDIKQEQLRYLCEDLPFNYGALPQTYENPMKIDRHTGLKGDGDPIDAIEISDRTLQFGEILQVKVIGSLALIDEGETDWKVITIDANHNLAHKINDIADLEREMPQLLSSVRSYFRNYKICAGNPPNTFAFDGAFQSMNFTELVVKETFDEWLNYTAAHSISPLNLF